MKRTWIHHAIIVNEGRRFAGSVVIEGEKIQEIIEGDGAPAAVCDEQIDAQGCFLLPKAKPSAPNRPCTPPPHRLPGLPRTHR